MSAELANFEGLVFRTAQMYAPILDDDEDDVRQVLRIKVWKALIAYQPARATQTVEKYVFMCLRNQVKDLLKKKKRDESFIEDLAPMEEGKRDRFEDRHGLAADAESVFASVEDTLPLPSSLTGEERHVVLLLYADYNQTEIAAHLHMTRQRVRALHASVQIKMADWKPSSDPRPAVAVPLAVAA